MRAVKGLSPLVATLVLIAFTVIGGLLVYEYFQRTSESLMASGEDLVVLAHTSYFDNSRLIVQLQMTNGYRVNITITGYSYITSTSTATLSASSIFGSTRISLTPGSKYSDTLLVPHNTKAVIITFKVRDTILYKTVPLG